MPPRTSALVLLLLLSLVIAACGGGTDPSGPQSTPASTPVGPESTAAPTAEPTAVLAALVNGEPITLAAFESESQRQEARYAEIGEVPADRAAFEATVLSGMIDQRLIEQAAVIQGVVVTEEEIEAEIALNIELAGSEEVWLAWLAANLYTPEEYRVAIRSALLTARIRDLVIAGVSDTAPQVHARHILVPSQAEAETIYQQIGSGTDFGELAFRYSQDVTTRELGGDLGWFTREQFAEYGVDVVAEVAFSLEPGAISEPFASRLGYHIVQTLAYVPDRPLDEQTRALLQENVFDRWLQSLREQADIQRFIGG